MAPLDDRTHGPITGSTTLVGFTALRRKLANLADAGTRERIGDRSVMAGGQVMVGPMRRAAPKRTRRIARSITVVLSDERKHRGVSVALAGPTRPGGEAAPVVEYGSGPRFTKNPRRFVGRMRAHPFVGPTGVAYAAPAREAMAESLARDIEAEASR
jgi:hypothetical protein